MSKPSPIEERILADIQRKTGLSFGHLAGIDTRDREIAAAVLPILKEWLPSVAEDNYRHTIVHRFVTPHAYPYIDSLIEWWQAEEDPLAATFLTQALATNAAPADGQRLWQFCQLLPRRPLHFMLLAKLATFPSVQREVKEMLLQTLNTPLTVGDLHYVAKVDDPRIRKWFEDQIDSANPQLKVLARRVVEKGKKLPKQVEAAVEPPNRRAEMFSTEVDLNDVKRLLEQLAKELRLKIPAPLRKPAFLSSLDIDRWVVVRIKTQAGDPVGLWFRMEDVDTVEIVVTKEISAPITVQ